MCTTHTQKYSFNFIISWLGIYMIHHRVSISRTNLLFYFIQAFKANFLGIFAPNHNIVPLTLLFFWLRIALFNTSFIILGWGFAYALFSMQIVMFFRYKNTYETCNFKHIHVRRIENIPYSLNICNYYLFFCNLNNSHNIHDRTLLT